MKYDLNTIRKITEENLSIVQVGEISADLLGTQLTMKDVIVTIAQEEVYFTSEIFVHDGPGVDMDNFYPIMMHETTKETMIDYDSPITFKPNMRWPLGLAVLIYLHDNAKGIRQNAFLQNYKTKTIEVANQS
ncbi:hypothetical protein [Rossellomorea sp. LjRoot5]|uniref:hypothetical protein n=1 Tax=Rossellomorea sp. LjRoot5 TaxID=3342331 RepID=UPI003ECCC975